MACEDQCKSESWSNDNFHDICTLKWLHKGKHCDEDTGREWGDD